MPRGIFQRKIVPNNERFWKHVQTSDDCWIWTSSRLPKGYGQFNVRQLDGTYRPMYAHRFAYELLIGKIPEGHDLHHAECENPPCVNPGHTTPMTKAAHTLIGNAPPAVNARKTHCPYGHKLSGANLIIRNGWRDCKICRSGHHR